MLYARAAMCFVLVGLNGATAAAEAEAEPDRATMLAEVAAEDAVVSSIIERMSQKLERYESQFETEGVSLAKINPLESYHGDDKCTKLGTKTYLDCLDALCLTTQCEQKTEGELPYGGFGSWEKKLCATDDCAALENENAMLQDIADFLMAQVQKTEQETLSKKYAGCTENWCSVPSWVWNPKDPKQIAKKAYWVKTSKLTKKCLKLGNAEAAACAAGK